MGADKKCLNLTTSNTDTSTGSVGALLTYQQTQRQYDVEQQQRDDEFLHDSCKCTSVKRLAQ